MDVCVFDFPHRAIVGLGIILALPPSSQRKEALIKPARKIMSRPTNGIQSGMGLPHSKT